MALVHFYTVRDETGLEGYMAASLARHYIMKGEGSRLVLSGVEGMRDEAKSAADDDPLHTYNGGRHGMR